jgi:pimeloyl-ACP methyl ester carboxylesterase
MESMLRILLFVGAVALLLYILYALYFYFAQRAILFPRHMIPPAPPAFQATDALDLGVTTDAGKVEAWLLLPQRNAQLDAQIDAQPVGITQSSPYPLVIIGHGNAEMIDQWIRAVTPLRQQGFAVMLVEYPGYGRSAGQPSEKAIVTVFTQAYDAAVARSDIDAERVILFGRSVGGGAVAQLSTQRPSAGMILFSTFTGVRDMASQYWLPGRLARDPFDTLTAVRAYTRPLLIIHGEQDNIIPFYHAQRITAAAPHAQLRPLPCGHNDCVHNWDTFWQELTPFWRLALELE